MGTARRITCLLARTWAYLIDLPDLAHIEGFLAWPYCVAVFEIGGSDVTTDVCYVDRMLAGPLTVYMHRSGCLHHCRVVRGVVLRPPTTRSMVLTTS